VLIFIPGGPFRMGSSEERLRRLLGDEYETDWHLFSAEQPEHTVVVAPFYLGQCEVTNAQWKKFIDANPEWGPEQIPEEFHDGEYLTFWRGNEPPAGKENHPVVGVSWYAAKAYCEWAGGRLPTEAEWEFAAQGPDHWEYPYGEFFDLRRANVFENGPRDTVPVGQYGPYGYGLCDLAGNVWEWCSSQYRPYPYAADDGREDLTAGGRRVIRGGAWFVQDYEQYRTRARARSEAQARKCSKGIGLRLALTPP